jgi:predicted amidophosphoribosyltransferase
MSDFQEAKKQETKKTVPPAPKAKEKNKERNDVLCQNCGASIPEGALFCPECGFDLSSPSFCPNCGAKTSPGADICPVCKTWLLEGQCKFCYTELAPDAVFCPECGNPKDGILCPNCGSLSIFDFCTKCGKPLTENAVKTLELAKDDPDAQTMIDAVKQAVGIETELAELETLINSERTVSPAPPQVKKSLFSDQQLSSIMKTGKNREEMVFRRAEEEKKAEEMARMNEEQKRQAEIREAKARVEILEKQKQEAIAAAEAARIKFQNKTFLSHQDARRFHNAMRPGRTSGWLCNFTNTVHFDGPNGCDQPGLGGYWYDGEVIIVERKGPS